MDSPQAKPGINPLMIIGFLISILGTLYSFATMPFMGVVFGLFTAINLIGIILSAAVTGKIGPILVIIGNIIFVPIGLIGAFGGRQALDHLKRMENLENSDPEEAKWGSLSE